MPQKPRLKPPRRANTTKAHDAGDTIASAGAAIMLIQHGAVPPRQTTPPDPGVAGHWEKTGLTKARVPLVSGGTTRGPIRPMCQRGEMPQGAQRERDAPVYPQLFRAREPPAAKLKKHPQNEMA